MPPVPSSAVVAVKTSAPKGTQSPSVVVVVVEDVGDDEEDVEESVEDVEDESVPLQLYVWPETMVTFTATSDAAKPCAWATVCAT